MNVTLWQYLGQSQSVEIVSYIHICVFYHKLLSGSVTLGMVWVAKNKKIFNYASKLKKWMRGNIFGPSKLDGIYFELIAPPLNSKSISHIYCYCCNAIAATARCHPLHSIVYQHNLFEVMHYIHPVAFIPLHFKFKMKTSVKINLKVLFVNKYDWTEPPNLWHL